jgi:hypothetical protein
MPVGSRIATRPTDDQGRFRVYGLTPADYYVIALSGTFRDPNATGGFAPTYYPGTTNAAEARPVRVGVGQDVTGLTFTLVPARMMRLSGIVVDAAGKPVDRATLSLSIADRLGRADFLFARAVSEADGAFTFRNVPPGTYTIQGYGRQVANAGNLGASQFGWLPVAVAEEDQPNLIVRVAKGPSLRGRITFEGDTAPRPRPNEVRVTASPVEFDAAPIGGGPPPSQMHDDYTFEVGNLSGRRAIRVTIRSPAWSVKRIVVDGKDVADTPVEFRGRDVENVEVVLTSLGPTVAGGVRDSDGEPVRDYNVVFYAADPSRWTFPSRFIALGRPNQDGRYLVRGLPPEDYLAVAVGALQGTEWQDPEFLERMRPMATPLTLREGDAKTIELTLGGR